MVKKTAAREWVDSGWGYKVSSRDQLLRTIGRISTLRQGRIYAWRGQSDGAFELSSSLYRHLSDEAIYDADAVVTEPRMRHFETQIIEEARTYGIGQSLGPSNTDAHLLATLQHHGTPTRLIDVTSNPFTALWFATQSEKGKRGTSGVLFAIDVTDMPWMNTFHHGVRTVAELDDPLAGGYQLSLTRSSREGCPFRLFPALPDDRMRAQEGFFLGGALPDSAQIPRVPALNLQVGEPPGAERLDRLVRAGDRTAGRPFALPFLALVIPPKIKEDLKDPLKGTFNRRRRVLFPDVAGFTSAFRSNDLDFAPFEQTDSGE